MIDTAPALADLVARIAPTDSVGVDTEADSLHCYREKVCLIQVGLPGADELVDPLADLDLAPLLAPFIGSAARARPARAPAASPRSAAHQRPRRGPPSGRSPAP